MNEGYATVTPYRHSAAFSEKCIITLYKASKDGDKKFKSLKNVKTDTEKKFKTSFTDGLYKVTATFTYQEKLKAEVSGSLYVNSKEIKACRAKKVLQQKIDKARYLVEVHFSDTSNQNVEDRLKRVILHDLEHGKQGKPRKSDKK